MPNHKKKKTPPYAPVPRTAPASPFSCTPAPFPSLIAHPSFRKQTSQPPTNPSTNQILGMSTKQPIVNLPLDPSTNQKTHLFSVLPLCKINQGVEKDYHGQHKTQLQRLNVDVVVFPKREQVNLRSKRGQQKKSARANNGRAGRGGGGRFEGWSVNAFSGDGRKCLKCVLNTRYERASVQQDEGALEQR